MKSTTIPFIDLRPSTERIHKRYLKAVARVLTKGNFILTPEVETFENEWARTIGTTYCVGVSNGADALYLALTACGVGKGDEVITQGNAYNASVTAIMRTGARPRFVDIDPQTLRIDVTKIERAVTSNTRAILPVHLYGQPANMNAISKIAKKHKLVVIEDCAQAHLASYNRIYVGNWGDVGAFSFYPTKNLGAFGDAGAITTNRRDLYEKIRALRHLGQTGKNVHTYYGFNMRLDPLQAICLSLKLPFLRGETRARIAAARRYDTLLKHARIPVVPLARDKYATPVYHLYVVLVPAGKRAAIQNELAKRGVATVIHYPVPVYRQPFFKGLHDACPVADRTADQVLSLPFFPSITAAEQRYVIEALAQSV